MKKLLYIFLFLLSLVWFFLFRPAFLGGPASYIIVSGISMEPNLFTGDLAVMQRQASYAVGEVVAFRVNGGNVIHRIVGGSAERGFITQGDNKPAIDPWQPKPENILGRMWFHIPEGGKPLQNLRQPTSIAALSGLALFFFFDSSPKERRKKRGKRMKAKSKGKGLSFTPPSWTLSALGTAALLALLFGAVAGYGYFLPAERSETVERLRYEHGAAFQYTLHTEPSLLYPVETIGPVGPAAPVAGAADGMAGESGSDLDALVPADGESGADSGAPPVFTRLARTLDLDFSYQLFSQAPAEVQGQVSIDLQIQAGDGWVTTQALVAPVDFQGSEAKAHATLDFQQIQEFLTAVEEQTGFSPGTYELALIPTVRLNGEVGGQSVREIYTPAFTLSLDETQIRLPNDLAQSEVKRIEEPILRPNSIRLLGLTLPVQGLRQGGVVGAAVCLLACCLFGALYLGIGQDETQRLQARYGGLIVPVAQTDLGTGRKVQVASMADLARLAQREESMIFHQSFKGADLYFVPDGQVVYTYLINKPAAESEAATL